MNLKGIVNRLLVVIWLAIPFLLLLLPVTYFDSGKSLCLSKVLLNTECPGCGITRGIQHAIHFDFIGAWEYNKLTFIVLPVLMVIWFKTLLTLIAVIRFEKYQ